MGLFGRKKTMSEREVSIEALSKKYAKILHKETIDDAIPEIVDNLMPGEEIAIVIPGSYASAIIATQHRIFVYKRGMMGGVTGGSKLITWDMDVIHGVQLEFGKVSGFIALQTPNAAVTDTSFWSSDPSSPEKAPNAIAINNRDQAKAAVISLRTLLFQRKQVAPSV